MKHGNGNRDLLLSGNTDPNGASPWLSLSPLLLLL